jgi:hypothetical protein
MKIIEMRPIRNERWNNGRTVSLLTINTMMRTIRKRKVTMKNFVIA